MGEREAVRVIRAGHDQIGTVRRRVEAFVGTSWVQLGSWRDPDIDRWVRQVVPVVLGAQRQIASLTAAYLAAIETEATGTPTRVVSIPSAEVTIEAVRGTPAETVYRRPAVTMRTALAENEQVYAAIQAGLRRALSIVSTDLQLAQTHAARETFTRSERVVGYRRTLTGAENCALCTIASTQRYTRQDLMPIHPGCDCGVAPIIGEFDPGQVINRPLLEQTQQAIADAFGAADRGARTVPGSTVDYRDIRVRDHGELGPVLTVRGQRFTGPDDL